MESLLAFASGDIRRDVNSWRNARIDSQIWDLVDDRIISLTEVLLGDERPI